MLPSRVVWEMEQPGTNGFQPGKGLLTHMAAGATASPGHYHLSLLVATPVVCTRCDKQSEGIRAGFIAPLAGGRCLIRCSAKPRRAPLPSAHQVCISHPSITVTVHKTSRGTGLQSCCRKTAKWVLRLQLYYSTKG